MDNSKFLALTFPLRVPALKTTLQPLVKSDKLSRVAYDIRGPVRPWPVPSFEELNAEAFEQIALLDPELVIFGSGSRLRFPGPQWLQALIARRIGVETMDTAAACRTYNVLVSEQRSVVAALIIEPGTVSAKNL